MSEFAAVSSQWGVSHTFLDMYDADLAVSDDETADCGTLFVVDTLCRGSQSERKHAGCRWCVIGGLRE